MKFFGDVPPHIDAGDCPGTLMVLEGSNGVGVSTQIQLLREWLEVQGYGVAVINSTQNNALSGAVVDNPNAFRHRTTYALLHAIDLADQIERTVLPAMRNGFIVLADRYMFTAIARAAVRGGDAAWLRDLFGFAPVPDLTIYLQADINSLIERTLARGPISDEAAGRELALGDDLFDCFKKYQTKLVREFNQMAGEFKFHTVNARKNPVAIQEDLHQIVATFLEGREKEQAPPPPPRPPKPPAQKPTDPPQRPADSTKSSAARA
jgi:dTMP kinase